MAADERGPQLAELFPDSATAGACCGQGRGAWRSPSSCTGGLLGAALTSVPGSSTYVLGGVIAYDNAVKIRLLDVAPDALAEHGAVSEEVAAAMARGVRERLGAEVGVSTTGVAGPGSEEGGKPAGLVFVALAAPGVERVVRLDGDHGREGNRAEAVQAALELLAGAGVNTAAAATACCRLLPPCCRCHLDHQQVQWGKHPFAHRRDQPARPPSQHRPISFHRSWSFCFDNNTRKSYHRARYRGQRAASGRRQGE